MANPFIGEVRIFAGNFAPAGWAFCNGSLLPIADYDTLFALIGTTYGGDGQVTFALPDLRSRVPIGAGTGPSLTPRTIGASGGVESVSLTLAQLPAHTHTVQTTAADALSSTPSAGVMLASNAGTKLYSPKPATVASANVVGSAQTAQPHDNIMPYGVVQFIISLYGIFPSQS